MMDYKDYYKTLGVERSATEQEVKQVYRKLARQFHPDVNPGDKEAEKRFQEINEAYEVLSDSDNRKKYDQLGQYWKQGGPPRGGGGGGGAHQVDFNLEDLFAGVGGGGGGAGSGFSSFFDRFFSGGAGGGGRRKPSQQPAAAPAATAEIEISLEECLQGTMRALDLSQETTCSQCGGMGVAGQGLCPACRGSGRQVTQKRLEVKIPAGVTQGSKVKAGGAVLTIKVKPHKDYEIKGRDLIRKLPVDLYQAVLGSEVKFTNLHGKEVSLKIPPESQNGKQFRLTGHGFPSVSGKAAGDLYLRVEIELPVGLSSEEKRLFEELAKLRKGGKLKRY